MEERRAPRGGVGLWLPRSIVHGATIHVNEAVEDETRLIAGRLRARDAPGGRLSLKGGQGSHRAAGLC